MKYVFPGILLVVVLFFACHRERHILMTGEDEASVEEEISYYPTDRNDIPPPPADWNQDVDTTLFDACQKKVWRYIGQFYPSREDNRLDVEVYTLQEVGDNFMERVGFHGDFSRFFEDTLTRNMIWGERPICSEELDTSFFLRHIGEPSCHTTAPSSVYWDEPILTYFYYIKNRDRKGPCPHMYEGSNGGSCFPAFYEYCCMLKLTFLKESGALKSARYSGI